jgi:ferritin-like metal-binding protein YciE
MPANLRWIELGGPTVAPPTHRGFGTHVMENIIGQLKGEVRFDWRDEGLACEEIIAEGEKKEDAAADLALIGAAQRVEHYEIAGYTTARNLAQQLRHSAIVSLLSKSLAEEENADQLLNQVARSLMSVARMPETIEQAE